MGFSRKEHWSGLPFPSPMHESEKWKGRCLVMSDSSWPHGLQPTRLLHPWDFPGKNTGVGCHCLLLVILDKVNSNLNSLNLLIKAYFHLRGWGQFHSLETLANSPRRVPRNTALSFTSSSNLCYGHLASSNTGLEKVSFHSNLKQRQCQRMLKLPHNCIHLTC